MMVYAFLSSPVIFCFTAIIWALWLPRSQRESFGSSIYMPASTPLKVKAKKGVKGREDKPTIEKISLNNHGMTEE